jgi:hypothetical protein
MCSRLPCQAALGLLASGQASCGYIILHHGALFQLVLDTVCMIWACRLEKLLKVIHGQPHLMFKITLGGSHELLIRVAGVLVVIIFIVTGGDRDSLGPPPQPPLVGLDV